MLQNVIAAVRVVMCIGVVFTVFGGTVFGYITAISMRFPGPVGAVIGAALSFGVSSISFGLIAAVFDIQEQLRYLVQISQKPLMTSSTIGGRNRSDSSNATPSVPANASFLPASVAEQVNQNPNEQHFREGPDGWRRIIAAAEADGWLVNSGITGVTFTHAENGRLFKANSVQEAVRKLYLP